MSRKLFVGMWAAHNLWLYVFIVLERKDNNKRNALLKEFLLFWKEKLFYAKIFVKWFWLIFDLWAVAHNLCLVLSSNLLFTFFWGWRFHSGFFGIRVLLSDWLFPGCLWLWLRLFRLCFAGFRLRLSNRWLLCWWVRFWCLGVLDCPAWALAVAVLRDGGES